MESRNFEQDMTIDESALDVEWLGQPVLTIKYAQLSAQAKMELDRAKMELDIATASLDLEIRKNPEKFGLPKVTEGAIVSIIAMQESWKKVNEKYFEAKYNQSVMADAMRAISDRKDALENLVRLHGQQYFAGPKVPRDLSAEYLRKKQSQARAKESNTAVASAIARTRRKVGDE